jgi:hypothetical protein
VEVTKHHNPYVGVLVPLALPIFGVALVVFGKWLGKGDEMEIVVFLEQTFSPEARNGPTLSTTKPPAVLSG